MGEGIFVLLGTQGISIRRQPRRHSKSVLANDLLGLSGDPRPAPTRRPLIPRTRFLGIVCVHRSTGHPPGSFHAQTP